MADYRLTTIDNPFDPFEEFNDWFLFDIEKGYNSCDLLARFASTSSEMTDEENEEENERAINEILNIDPTGLYIRVEKGKFKKPISSDLNVLLSTE